MPEITIQTIVKRDGRRVPFSVSKITDAIFKAAESVGGKDRTLSEKLTQDLVIELEKKFATRSFSVEDVQDLVEKILIEKGHARTAKAYILFRYKKAQEREKRALILGDEHPDDNLHFSSEALTILERRYLGKDAAGTLRETPKDMLDRIAANIASADAKYGADAAAIAQTRDRFYYLLASLIFLPNTPTLMNAGTKNQLLPASFVLPIDDTMESIFGTLQTAAILHQRGAGTGFSFSRLRPKHDPVKHHSGVAGGPVAFLRVYDAALEIVKQGGIRPGANMAVLRVDHPDILRFIEAKHDKRSLKNFNISVGVTDRFMKAVEDDRDYVIFNPRTEKYVGKLRARDIFSVITQNAWKTGDPGLVFIDEINKRHPCKHLGEIETTNQCAEAPLLPYEGCMFGSIDLSKFVDLAAVDINYSALGQAVATAIHFLDNALDMTQYPIDSIRDACLRTRKVGLGLMGFADAFVRLGIKYDSEAGLAFAEKVMSFIKAKAYGASQELAASRGVFPAFKGSDHETAGRKMRNATCLALSPTGTRSILAGCSAGCEPLFAISYQRTVLGTNEIVYLNTDFEKVARERGFYSSELIWKVSKAGTLKYIKEIPKDVRDVFVTAQDIEPVWHIKMQATLQKYVDNSISKTINFPRTAAIRDVEEAYMLAWKSKCKGITIYRDGSYEDQVITVGDGMS